MCGCLKVRAPTVHIRLMARQWGRNDLNLVFVVTVCCRFGAFVHSFLAPACSTGLAVRVRPIVRVFNVLRFAKHSNRLASVDLHMVRALGRTELALSTVRAMIGRGLSLMRAKIAPWTAAGRGCSWANIATSSAGHGSLVGPLMVANDILMRPQDLFVRLVDVDWLWVFAGSSPLGGSLIFDVRVIGGGL